jgi:hypothetical protein
VTLHPRLRPRIVYFTLGVLLFALCVGAAFYNPVVGVVGVLVLGFVAVNGAFRLFHPRSYVTEIDADEFRVYDSMGRLKRHVRWREIVDVTVVNGNGLGGAGSTLLVAWRCEPRQPAPGWQQMWKGGRNRLGHEYDGALPDPYLGIHQMVAIFKERIEAAQAGGAAVPVPADVHIESF